jgi:hypothetical protein
MVIAMLILTILAAAFFSAGGYSMLQQYLQQQTTSDTEKAQAHLTDCRNHFLELLQKANGVLAKANDNDKYINNNCADGLNTSIIKQTIVANILPSLNNTDQNQNFQAATQNVDRNWNTVDTVKSEYKQVSVFCIPVRLPSLVWYQWCIW